MWRLQIERNNVHYKYVISVYKLEYTKRGSYLSFTIVSLILNVTEGKYNYPKIDSCAHGQQQL